jgi:Secretion system C-terminal sorting domain
MKKTLLICLAFLSITSYAQTLNGPESIEWDEANNRWLIGNTGNGTIIARSTSGVLSSFVSGIPSGPYGIEILGNVLYACSGSTIRGYNLTTGASVFTLNVGATFLNGLTSDGTNFLYATDFSAKRIVKIDTAAGTFTNIATGLAKTPNGILYEGANNRCLYVTWGANASIMAIDLTTFAVTTVLATTLSNCDGITKDSCGNYYVTSWGNNKLNKFNNTLTGTSTVVPGTLSSPADIDCKYGTTQDEIGITNNSNTLSFVTVIKPDVTISEASGVLSTIATYQTYQWYLNGVLIPSATAQNYTPTTNGNYYCIVTEGTCSDTSNTITVSTLNNQTFEENTTVVVYPNPATAVLNIAFNGANNAQYRIVNLLGQEVITPTIALENAGQNHVAIPLDNLKTGNYILQITTNGEVKNVKFSKK